VSDPKKPGLSLVIGFQSRKPKLAPDDDDKDGADETGGDEGYSESFKAACDEVSDALGISDDDKREALCDALYAAIMAAK